MRICFGALCFSSLRSAAVDEEAVSAATAAASDRQIKATAMSTTPPLVSPATAALMSDVQDYQSLLHVKEEKIRDLEELLRCRDQEIVDLRSHLDKFQSVFPFHINAAVGAVSPKHKGLNNNVGPGPRARKQRAQGISAEPQSERSQETFPVYEKDER